VLFVACVLAIIVAMAVPQVFATRDSARGLAAARYLSARMALARAQAVSRSASVALRLEDVDGDLRLGLFEDGNGDGVRTRDIESGLDRRVEADVMLSTLFPGVGLGAGAGEEGGVRIGRTTLLSFTPAGTATSGTVYLHGPDGAQWAVRVLGATARTRVLRYAPTSGEWVDVR
jgi:hypothetical protein